MQTDKVKEQARAEGYHKKTRENTDKNTPKNGEKVSNPLNQPKDISFPYEVISGVAGDYVNLMADVIEAPKQFTYMSFITCLGSLFAKRLTLDTFHKPQPRFFTVLIGPSGGSRKSTTIKTTIDFVNSGLHYDNRINLCYGIGSDIGLLKKLDSTDNILLNLDEFKQLTAKSSIKGNNLLPCISTLFDGNRYENQTKNESIVIERGYLSILAASTPETYRKHLGAGIYEYRAK